PGASPSGCSRAPAHLSSVRSPVTDAAWWNLAMTDRFDLKGKVALVTGGSRGMGREMVLAFAEAGADVVIASRKLDACAAVAEEVEKLGRRALPVAAHVGHWDQCNALADAA